MTAYYCASTGSNTAPYDTWAKAATALKTVTDLLGAGDIAYCRNEAFVITVDTVYTLAGTATSPCTLISTASTAEPPTTIDSGFMIDGSGTAGVDITITGKARLIEMDFKSGGSTSAANVNLATTSEDSLDLDTCNFIIANSSAASEIVIGVLGSNTHPQVRTFNCGWTFGNNASQGFDLRSNVEMIGGSVSITTTVPTNLIKLVNGGIYTLRGVDLSAITTNLVIGSTRTAQVYLDKCKLGSGVTPLNTSGLATGPEIYMTDCATGDTHYEFAHYNYYGNTTVSTAIYLNNSDGSSYNVAGSKYSWKITGVNGSWATPYRSPWITRHNEAVASVTPRIEILRDGSASAYTDREVWGEWMVKATAGSVLPTFSSDRCGDLTAAANQAASALGASDWAGEGGTAWFGKLSPAAVTPAEIGDIMGRVCVAGANTVYVNVDILGV